MWEESRVRDIVFSVIEYDGRKKEIAEPFEIFMIFFLFLFFWAHEWTFSLQRFQAASVLKQETFSSTIATPYFSEENKEKQKKLFLYFHFSFFWVIYNSHVAIATLFIYYYSLRFQHSFQLSENMRERARRTFFLLFFVNFKNYS